MKICKVLKNSRKKIQVYIENGNFDTFNDFSAMLTSLFFKLRICIDIISCNDSQVCDRVIFVNYGFSFKKWSDSIDINITERHDIDEDLFLKLLLIKY